MKRAENTVGKGEIALYEQFLLFPQCFQKTYTEDTLKPGLVWERVNYMYGLWSRLNLKIRIFSKYSRSKNGHNSSKSEFRVISLVCTYSLFYGEHIF